MGTFLCLLLFVCSVSDGGARRPYVDLLAPSVAGEKKTFLNQLVPRLALPQFEEFVWLNCM